MNPAGTAPEWNRTNYAGYFQRSTTLASGTQDVSLGVTLKPSGILFVGCINNLPGRMSFAFVGGGGTATYGVWDVYNTTANAWYYATSLVFRQGASSAYQYSGVVSSFNADGFTITWTKGASAIDGETITVSYLVFR